MVEPAVNGTKYVIMAAAEAKVRRVVFTSSIGAVYMDPNRDPEKVVDESCWSDLEFCKSTKVCLLSRHLLCQSIISFLIGAVYELPFLKWTSQLLINSLLEAPMLQLFWKYIIKLMFNNEVLVIDFLPLDVSCVHGFMVFRLHSQPLWIILIWRVRYLDVDKACKK